MSSGFQEDLAADLSDPEFLLSYVIEAVRISTTDAIINARHVQPEPAADPSASRSP